ncbi:uncharacterized protein [Pleurodeles waltl]|uniref:uncharacterized protein n=1 Tax=Pleurodeles waltl TaxID=8319 RepID=UPI003709B2D1
MQDHDFFPTLSPGEGPSQCTLPPEVDVLISQAIAKALAPLNERVAKLSEVAKGTGMFGGTGANSKTSVNVMAPKKLRKRNAGHLEGFDHLTKTFHKNTRELKRLPFQEGLLPRETGEEAHHIWGPDVGLPKWVEGDTEGDFSSGKEQESGQPWHPVPPPPDQQEAEDSSSDMSDPEGFYHLRSSEWRPEQKVAEYVASKIRQPLDKLVWARLKAECPRPTLPGKVAATPELDPKMCTFFAKYVKDPKKGIDRSWRACQDKLLDVLGPLTQIIQLAEHARRTDTPLPTDIVAGWAQRAVCLLGNANCAISTERRRSLLIKIDPNLEELSGSEAGAVAQGNLFGDPFFKKLGKFVATLSALDKAQTSIKRIFPQKVFGGAGRGRVRSSGHLYQQGPSTYANRNNGWCDGRQGAFFPNRGRGKGRTGRGPW